MTARLKGAVLALLLAAVGAGGTAALAAEDRGVIVTTKAGERVEGIFRGGNDERINVEVGGRSLAFSVDTIRSITFAESAAQGVPTVTDLAGVVESLRPFQAALTMGMLRAEYADKLQQVLPPIIDFIKSRKPYWYPDAQLALNTTIEAYKGPLATAYSWSSASSDWQRASAYLHYAEDVVRMDPPGHREDPTEKRLTLGTEIGGRIGFGDAPGPEFLGSSTLADVYQVEVARVARVVFSAEGGPCALYEELRDGAGRDVSTMHVKGGWAARVRPGAYRLIVYCGDGGVGTYKLRTAVAP